MSDPWDNKIKIRWPIEESWNHNNIKDVIQGAWINEDCALLFRVLEDIGWGEIFSVHEKYYSEKSKGISKALNHVINNKLLRISDYRVPIFAHEEYRKAPYLMEYKIRNLAIDVASGHYNTLLWKIARLSLAVEENDLEKLTEQKVGVLILVDEELKRSGNFDPSVCTWQQAVEYMKLFKNQWSAPLLLICINDPGNFRVTDNGSGSNPRSTIHTWD